MSTFKHVMYPFRRISFSSHNQIIEKAKAYYGFYCKECFEPIILKGNITINLSVANTNREEAEEEVDFFGAFVYECPKCHHKNIWTDWPLDPNIAPMIAALNAKGYQTVASCEGHEINRLDQLYPYIHFMYLGQKRVLRYIPLQGPWKLEDDDNEFIIYCADNSIGLREKMAHLRFWVRALPECFDETFTEANLPDNLKERLYKLNSPLDDLDTGDGLDEKYLKMDPLENIEDFAIVKLPDGVKEKLAKQKVPEVIRTKDTRYTYAQLVRERKKKIKELVKTMDDTMFSLDDLPDDVVIPIRIPNPYDGVELARAKAWVKKQEELEEWRKTRRLGKEHFKDHQKEVRARLERRAQGLPDIIEEPKSTKGQPGLPYNGKKNSPKVFVPKEIRDAIPHNSPKKKHKKDKPKGPRNYSKIRKS